MASLFIREKWRNIPVAPFEKCWKCWLMICGWYSYMSPDFQPDFGTSAVKNCYTFCQQYHMTWGRKFMCTKWWSESSIVDWIEGWDWNPRICCCQSKINPGLYKSLFGRNANLQTLEEGYGTWINQAGGDHQINMCSYVLLILQATVQKPWK